MNSLSVSFRRIASHFRQFGPLGGLKLLILAWMRELFFSEQFLFLELKPVNAPQPVSLGDGVAIRALFPEEEELCIAIIGRVQRENETVFVAERAGETLGYARTQVGGSYRFGRGGEILLPPDVLILKGLHVNLAARGRKIGLLLNQARVSAAHTAGRKVFVSAMSENRAALKNLRKTGFQDVAELSRVSVLGKTLSRRVRAYGSGTQLPQWLKDFE